MKTSRIWFWTLGISLLVTGITYAELTVEITSPSYGASYAVCSDIQFEVDVQTTAADGMKEVRYYYQEGSVGLSNDEPYGILWEEVPAGNYRVYARARDQDNTVAYSDTILIKVGDLDHGDLILNGSFDCLKTTPWRLVGYEGAAGNMEAYDDGLFDDDTYLYVDVTQAGTMEWHLQLQHDFPIYPGHSYEITFAAAADDEKEIDMTIQQNVEPHIEYLHEDITVDGIDWYGPFYFDCVDDDPGAILKFNIANNLIGFYLDEVSIIDDQVSSVKAINMSGKGISSFTLHNAYPNPFNMNVTIPYELNQPGDVTLSVYDVNGRHVKTLFTGSQSVGIHAARWDGTSMTGQIVPSGVYFVHMDTGTGNRTSQLSRKILLMK
ncbi:T9SS type A sorting domain-containing protein [candidate division KSB1 bacterium]|nr:T9SS type A sorting domain-containing protein [candidate division KSB1 bacterium]